MNTETIKTLLLFTGAGGILLGLLMMFVTTYYLNHSKRRARLIELVWGTENEYYRGKKMDWVMCNYVFSGSTFTAWRMKIGLTTKKQKQVGSYGYPMLHKNQNYLKLLTEFPFFVKWEASKIVFILLGFLCWILSDVL